MIQNGEDIKYGSGVEYPLFTRSANNTYFQEVLLPITCINITIISNALYCKINTNTNHRLELISLIGFILTMKDSFRKYYTLYMT